jgi:hypothetical protein
MKGPKHFPGPETHPVPYFHNVEIGDGMCFSYPATAALAFCAPARARKRT